jgi:hypothetical protein
VHRNGACAGVARTEDWRVYRSGAYAGVARIQEWRVYRSGAYTGVVRIQEWRVHGIGARYTLQLVAVFIISNMDIHYQLKTGLSTGQPVTLLKFTAQSGGAWHECMGQRVRTIVDSLPRSAVIVIAWDADNMGTNKILDTLIPSTIEYCKSKGHLPYFSMGTFRSLVLQGTGWPRIVYDRLVRYDSLPNAASADTDPSTDRNQRLQEFHRLTRLGVKPNKNGWLGAEHVRQWTSWDGLGEGGINPHVLVFGHPPSWNTEYLFLPATTEIHMIHHS